MKNFSIAAYISGSGTNLKAILKNIEDGYLNSKVKVVITNNPNASGLEYPQKLGIATFCIERKKMTREEFAQKQLSILEEFGIDLIVLAGYIRKITPKVLDKFQNHILNIHPALLPEFGGKGMYGKNVHKAVIEAKSPFSGPTIHLVDKIYDHGIIIHQRKIPVLPTYTPEGLAQKVLNEEYLAYSEALKKIENEEIVLG